jgi:hypothetical protein
LPHDNEQLDDLARLIFVNVTKGDNMATQPKLESEPRQTNQNHHGPFYRSSELVAAVPRAKGGIFETFRAAHALGRIYEASAARAA